MRVAVRLLAPVLLVYLLAVTWSYPWDHHPLSAALIAAVLSGARCLYGLRRPPPRLAEMAPEAARTTKQTALWGGLGMLGLGLGTYGFCRMLLSPLPPGVHSLQGTLFDDHVYFQPGVVALAFASIVVIYAGFAALVRLAELATDRP
jgi:hypothetical protein